MYYIFNLVEKIYLNKRIYQMEIDQLSNLSI